MPPDADLIRLERSAWDALATSGEAAAAYFERALARRVLMLLPGGLVIDDRAEAIQSMGGTPWDEFDLSDERVLPLSDDSAVVAYRARARRGEIRYEAMIASTYVREGDFWRMALHQQTPV